MKPFCPIASELLPETGKQRALVDGPGRACVNQGQAGFTMVEIAICIAVVAFAMVAIIGVLPTGLQVQRQNREDTIINQEGSLWLEAIRSGSLGLDYLTNHVELIHVDTVTNRVGQSVARRRTSDYRYVPPASGAVGFKIGRDIIGLLSLPRFVQLGEMVVQATNTIAYVRALTGSVADKTPANDFAFMYRMKPELYQFSALTGVNTNLNEFGLSGENWVVRSNAILRAFSMRMNLYELRLTIDWPLYRRAGGQYEVGGNRKIFRTLVSGSLIATNVDYLDQRALFFLQPARFVLPQSPSSDSP